MELWVEYQNPYMRGLINMRKGLEKEIKKEKLILNINTVFGILLIILLFLFTIINIIDCGWLIYQKYQGVQYLNDALDFYRNAQIK